MKELSIEQKAQRYDEAIERAKGVIEQNPLMEYLKKGIEYIFPELKESEDERIRKSLSAYFAKFKPNDMWNDEFSFGDIVSWFEAQGEHANFRNKIQIGDKVTRNEDGVLVNLSQLKRVAKKQGEQKSVVIIPKFRVGDEIKTSNEESLTITKIDEKGYWSENLFIGDFGDVAKWELVEQKPAWSEEDEDIINHLLAICAGAKRYRQFAGCSQDDVTKYQTWLKSFKERYTWKPSERQKEALLWCVVHLGDADKQTLGELLEELNKLLL